jgi:hypothetical protein
MATMAAAATTLGWLTTTQEAALASRSYPSLSPLWLSAFSHSKKFAHGASIASGTCWRRELVLRQRRSRRGVTLLLCMSSLRTSTEETATTSSDSQFSNYKPSTACLFPGQVKQTTATNKNVCLHRSMCNC